MFYWKCPLLIVFYFGPKENNFIVGTPQKYGKKNVKPYAENMMYIQELSIHPFQYTV